MFVVTRIFRLRSSEGWGADTKGMVQAKLAAAVDMLLSFLRKGLEVPWNLLEEVLATFMGEEINQKFI